MAAPGVIHTNDIMEVVHQAHDIQTNGEIINRHFFQCLNTPATPVDTMLDAAIGIKSSWVTNFLPGLSDQYQLDKTIVKRVTGSARGVPTTGKPHPFLLTFDTGAEDPSSSRGLQPGGSLPVFVTASLVYKTALVGRYWRGGIHLGPLTPGDVAALDNNQLTAGAVNFYETALLNYRTPLVLTNGTAVQLVIFSPTYLAWPLNNAVPPFNAVSPLNGQACNKWVRTQSSRKAPHVP